jgi:hypothetical protein
MIALRNADGSPLRQIGLLDAQPPPVGLQARRSQANFESRKRLF